MSVEGGTDGSGVYVVGGGGRWFQREVHEVEAVLPNPVDLLHDVAGRVIHGTDLHGSLPVNSIPSGYSTDDAGKISRGRIAIPPAVLTIGHSNHPLDV